MPEHLIETSFTPVQLSILLPALLLMLLSLLVYQRGNTRFALLLLCLGALGLRIFMILLDPFLNDWDERFHALVAKNMITQPFKPMLWADPALPYDYRAWCCNHIWVHKQPFFLWQMALSMKLFGVNEVALRLPSALLGAIQPLLIYRIGANLGLRPMGYLAAFLFALSNFQLEQTSGWMGRDHNDVAFAFYVTAGFWSLSEYLSTGKRSFLLLIGFFTGIAILNKWLVGLLIFGGWGLAVLLSTKERRLWSNYKALLIAAVVAVLTALPWQLYILLRFPREAWFEYGFAGSHLFQAHDQHSGGPFFYFEHNNWMYGDWSWLLILSGLLGFLWLVPKGLFKTVCLTTPTLVYLLFSLAGTKSVSYVFVINFVVFLFLAAFILGLVELVRQALRGRFPQVPVLMLFLLTIGLGYVTLQHHQIEKRHPLGKWTDRAQKLHNTAIYRRLNDLVPPGYVIFNCSESVEAMFYSDRICHFWLSPEAYRELKAKGVKMAAFQDHKYVLPDYLKNDPEVLIIAEDIRLGE